MQSITILCPARIRSMIDFAHRNGCEAQLGIAFLRLLSTCSQAMIEPETDPKRIAEGLEWKEKEVSHIAQIVSDWAPQSLGFAVYQGLVEREFRVLNGGFIYCGPGQPGDGSAPALTVSLEAPQSGVVHSWGIHT